MSTVIKPELLNSRYVSDCLNKVPTTGKLLKEKKNIDFFTKMKFYSSHKMRKLKDCGSFLQKLFKENHIKDLNINKIIPSEVRNCKNY